MTPVRHTILQLGHPGLRQPAQHIDDIRDPALQGAIDDLLHTMTEAGGVGIAAPQAGILQQ
ncbi:MAG: peptide deformylase, partial [Thermosynechococcaceae cyanobacterium]